MRHVFRLLPSEVRCKFCNAPFDGPSAPVMKVFGRGPPRLTSEFCHQCQVTATQFIGGAEIELTMPICRRARLDQPCRGHDSIRI